MNSFAIIIDLSLNGAGNFNLILRGEDAPAKVVKHQSKITRAPIGSRTVSEERVVSPTAGGYPPRPPKKSNRVVSLESDWPVQNVVHSRPAGACGYRV